MTAPATTSPWLTLAEAAEYTRRGKRFLAREVQAGRLRAARVGGRGEILTRREWLDQFLEDLATPVLVTTRRRA
jgi:excisionase family DNA binding protein